MILTLFGVLVFIAVVLVIIGLARPTESAQALIGFFLLFVLSLVIISGNLEFETGSQINTTYTYDTSNLVNGTSQQIAYTYSPFVDATGSNTAHWIGYYLALASAIGFVGVIWSIRRVKRPD